jgi:RimJ/RimL family protein N-acetyltransferase
MRVISLTDSARIREFLLTDRFFADYALGDLDPAHFQFTEWFGAEENGELRAVVMLYHGLNPSIFFATGEARGIEAILSGAVKLPRIGLSIHEEHLPVIERFYRAEPVPMLKMSLLPEDFQQDSESRLAHTCRIAAVGRWAQPDGERWSNTNRLKLRVPTSVWKLLRLDVSHMPPLEELYSHGGGDAFRRRSLELGVFYGVFDDERLVSVAGTHIVSDNERIAALGNVMTHPDYRGQGLATMATSAVCEELLDRGIELIGLSVSRSNVTAIRVYEKIGFIRRVLFYEGTATRGEH